MMTSLVYLVHFTTKTHTIYDYHLENHSVSRVSEIKDLGVIFDTSLSFKNHYSFVIKKALNMWGFIWRHSSDLSPSALKSLYCSLVRSNFDYCSPVWSPIYKVDSERLEKVQKKFLRTMEFKSGHRHVKGSYNWIMNMLDIQSLFRRRLIADACFLHGIINGHIDQPYLLGKLSFLLPVISSRITRSKNIFRVPTSSTTLAHYHPLKRMMKAANEYSNRSEISVFELSKARFRSQISLYYNKL
mgnify:FL=1